MVGLLGHSFIFIHMKSVRRKKAGNYFKAS